MQQQRHQATNSLHIERQGVTTRILDRYIVRHNLQNPFIRAIETTRQTVWIYGREISADTVRRRIFQGPYSINIHVTCSRDFRIVLFTYESRFCVSTAE